MGGNFNSIHLGILMACACNVCYSLFKIAHRSCPRFDVQCLNMPLQLTAANYEEKRKLHDRTRQHSPFSRYHTTKILRNGWWFTRFTTSGQISLLLGPTEIGCLAHGSFEWLLTIWEFTKFGSQCLHKCTQLVKMSSFGSGACKNASTYIHMYTKTNGQWYSTMKIATKYHLIWHIKEIHVPQ